MCVMLLFCFIHKLLPYYLKILSLELSYPESRASLRGDIIPFNTGGAMNETTEIQAQLLHYTIVFS